MSVESQTIEIAKMIANFKVTIKYLKARLQTASNIFESIENVADGGSDVYAKARSGKYVCREALEED